MPTPIDVTASPSGTGCAGCGEHPLYQPAPGPEGRVPADWQSKLNG